MIEILIFPRPAALDGDQLAAAIGGVRVFVADDVLRVVGEGIAARQAEIAAIIAAHVPQESDASKARRFVVGQITDAVGVAWGSLTAAQKQALIVALLYRAGALDGQARVRPLAEWL